MPISKFTPLPTFCTVLSNNRLAASAGHTNTDKPLVNPGDIIRVDHIQSYGFEQYVKFTFDGVTAYLPTSDVQELYLSDPSDATTEYAERKWAEVQERLAPLPEIERQAEIRSLLNNVTVAGNGQIRADVLIVFCEALLSTVRA